MTPYLVRWHLLVFWGHILVFQRQKLLIQVNKLSNLRVEIPKLDEQNKFIEGIN